MSGPSPYNIETYGCKVNFYDTGLLQKRLGRSPFSAKLNDQKVHVINSCAVTEEATKEALRRIRKLKTKDPNSLVVVTGCAAQVDTEKFAQTEYADLVVANSHKGQLENLIEQHLKGELDQKVFKSSIFKKDDLEAGGGERVRSHPIVFKNSRWL